MSRPSKATNGRVIFNSIPSGYPVPGETTVYEEEEIDLNAPLNGGALVKLLAISVDPYLRGKMHPREEVVRSLVRDRGNIRRKLIGVKRLVNFAVGVVLRSENPKVQAGEHVYGFFAFQNYVFLDANADVRVLKNTEKLPWSVYVGVAGMPGQTAYVGWKLFAKAKKGETVYISACAGSVGGVVAQIAKSQGLKVIGSAGSEEKVAFLRDELKIDIAFNYKTTDTLKVLEDAGGIDIYWDNVGGPQLEAALTAGHEFLRVINCGAIITYNGAVAPVSNINLVVTKRISMEGSVVSDHPELMEEANEYLPAALARGDIKYREHVYSLKEAGQAIADVQKGTNTGKAVIIL